VTPDEDWHDERNRMDDDAKNAYFREKDEREAKAKAVTEKHCPTCVCGRRAPVQGDQTKGPGTISWAEHELAWATYAARHGSSQSAEEIAARSGFGYTEVILLLGREPETWVPVGRGGA